MVRKITQVESQKIKLATELICEISERAGVGVAFFIGDETRNGVVGCGGMHQMSANMIDAYGAFLLTTPAKDAMDKAEEAGIVPNQKNPSWKFSMDDFVKKLKEALE